MLFRSGNPLARVILALGLPYLLVNRALRFVCARALVRALMTRKSCAVIVEMRNAILRNYLTDNYSSILVEKWSLKVEHFGGEIKA